MRAREPIRWEDYRERGESPAGGDPIWEHMARPYAEALRDTSLTIAGFRVRKPRVNLRYLSDGLDWLQERSYVERKRTAIGHVFVLTAAGLDWLREGKRP